jgi:peptidoglycan/xylan/chitin deacetylase (PgdA/CDA1 family)
MVLFKAPDSTGVLTVSCRLLERKKALASYQFVLTAFKQVVVLKADDLVYHASGIFPQNWNEYFALVDSLGIKGSAGIIGNSLENAPQAYYNKIKMLHEKGHIEFWNHGYSHSLNMRNQKGELCHEFFNRDYQDQYRHLNRTQELGRSKLGIRFRAFGAPGNAIDQQTTSLIDLHDDISIWFYGDPASGKSILKGSATCEIEYPTHKPDYHKFLAHYPTAEEFLTLQFHPTSWDQDQFADFRKIVLHLYRQGVLFMTPSEFAMAFNPELIEPETLL